MSKLLERLTLCRLRPHVLSGNFSEFKSAYRPGHSTETALLRVHNDLIRNAEDQRTAVLFALYISAAFDTIDFDTLSNRLKMEIGLGGLALDWLRSFLIGRTQYVGVGSSRVQISNVSVRCPPRECSWSVAVCDVHFSNQQRCRSTSPAPSVRRRHSALR